MIIDRAEFSVRAQAGEPERGAQFRDLVGGQSPRATRLSQQARRSGVREWQGWHGRWGRSGPDEQFAPPQKRRAANTEQADASATNAAAPGGSVASLLANVLIEAQRQPATTVDDWQLIVPLNRLRFPDSAALMHLRADSIAIEFRSCNEQVVFQLRQVLNAVSHLTGQHSGRVVQCGLRQVANTAELYQC